MRNKSKLLQLFNVGPVVIKKLNKIGIFKINQLQNQSPEILFAALEKAEGKQHPAYFGVLSAIIHEAQTGEKTPWHLWLKKKKN